VALDRGHREQIDDHVQEFPRIDDRFKGSRHRYGFCVGMRPEDRGTLAGPMLLRHDLDARRTEEHDFGPGRETGEAVFVPRAADAPEGDGWLLSLVYDHATDRSELSVLDTADFTGEPVATVPLPVRVPHGFHASWITQY
jgi:carotenoid cleavage dioxygenase-like enzyme